MTDMLQQQILQQREMAMQVIEKRRKQQEEEHRPQRQQQVELLEPRPQKSAPAAQAPDKEKSTADINVAEEEVVRTALDAADPDALIPEWSWLAVHAGTAQLTVEVPDMELQGVQVAARELPVAMPSLQARVGDVKNEVAGRLGLPSSKLRLSRCGGGFLRDGDSLAYYNLGLTERLSLSAAIKTRGGKRKK
eukprot:gene4671-5719_t